MSERWQQTPPGMRDLLPEDAARAREVIDAVLGVLRRWGYREVVTPTLEYLDVLVRGEGTEAADRLFKLVDRGGELLALRPEMTTPVARLVATQLRDAPFPLRIAYAGQVFRGGETGAGRLREFPQVGCELVGADSREADAEIVALAVETLHAAGVPRFSLSLGHGGFLRSLLESLGLSDQEMRRVRAALYQKDFVGLRALLEGLSVPGGSRDLLLALPTLRGPAALREAQGLMGAGRGAEILQDLQTLQGMLRAYGVDEAVTVDLSIIRDFNYYTGIVFEGHTPSLGAPLLGGGRYDRLLERFGVSLPATGFALRVERVLAACAPDPGRAGPDVVVGFDAGGREAALRHVLALRAQGLVVEVDVQHRTWDDVVQHAGACGAARTVYVRSDGALVREADGRERHLPLDGLRKTASAPGAAS